MRSKEKNSENGLLVVIARNFRPNMMERNFRNFCFFPRQNKSVFGEKALHADNVIAKQCSSCGRSLSTDTPGFICSTTISM